MKDKLEKLERRLLIERVKRHYIENSVNDYQLRTLIEKGVKTKDDYMNLKHVPVDVMKVVIDELTQ